MANKTPFHVVVQKIQSKKISEKELGQFFLIERNFQRPFDFSIQINTDEVDVSNVENASLLADALLRDAGFSLERKHGRGRRRAVRYKRKSPIIAEGDSWFRLPHLPPLVPRTLIDLLQEKYDIVNLAHWGDTLADMVLKGEFWPYILPDSTTGQYKSDVLLFSAGGNDVLNGDQLWRFINLFDVDHQKTSDAPYYVNSDFYSNLEVVCSIYESLIRQVSIRAPKVIMVGHGYDHVIPRIGGNWLYGPLARQGLRYEQYPDLCEAILRIMIDAFNSKLSMFEQRYPKNFRYVNLRGTIKRNEWWDELHPLEKGAKKTAAKFAAAIEALPASGMVLPSLKPFRANMLRAA